MYLLCHSVIIHKTVMVPHAFSCLVDVWFTLCPRLLTTDPELFVFLYKRLEELRDFKTGLYQFCFFSIQMAGQQRRPLNHC